MTAAEKMALISKALDEGRTVYLTTQTRSFEITPRVRERFASAGHPVLRVSASGSLRLAEGRGYVSADFCSISVA